MWMAVLKKEMAEFEVGTMWCVYRTKTEPILVTARILDLRVEPPCINTQYAPFLLTIEDARKYFTTPTQDLTDLMEESVMQSERAYC